MNEKTHQILEPITTDFDFRSYEGISEYMGIWKDADGGIDTIRFVINDWR